MGKDRLSLDLVGREQRRGEEEKDSHDDCRGPVTLCRDIKERLGAATACGASSN